MTSIKYTGGREELDVNATEENIDNMKDSNGKIWFIKVMRWCLPCFDNGEIDLFTWQAQRMSNYLQAISTYLQNNLM